MEEAKDGAVGRSLTSGRSSSSSGSAAPFAGDPKNSDALADGNKLDVDFPSLVADAVADDKGIRQWVITGSVPQERLVEDLDLSELTSAVVQERADLANAEAVLEAVESRGPAGLLHLLELLWPSLRRRRQQQLDVRITRADVDEARAKLHGAMLTEVKRQLRTSANANRGDLFSLTLPNLEYEDLAELEQPTSVVTTSARKRLEHFVRDMPGGSIGLAGPRGAGKSTLIRTICPTVVRGPTVGVVVAAPVDFTAREFILHLFAELCRTVIGRNNVEALRMPDPLSPRSRPRVTVRALLLAAPLAIVAGISLILLTVVPGIPKLDPRLVWGGVLTLAGILGLGYSLLQFPRVTGLRIWPLVPDFMDGRTRGFSSHAVDLATKRLKDIWFQQTFTTGWSGALKLPLGIEGGLTGSEEVARQQMSMPDIVSELRELIEEIAKTKVGSADSPDAAKVSVRIGIDELDKIEPAEDAQRFMNEIKVLFGIPRCFFFVSVSEDAMSAFERRGLPFRDVFDSSFDDIVRVGYLDAQSAISLVQGRVIGMPIPFILLGHCMAGGLARDLIRVVRDIVVLGADRPETRELGLSEVCHELVCLDVRGKAEACVLACTRMKQSPQVERLQSWFRETQAATVSAEALLERCSNAERDLGFLGDDPSGTDEQRSPAALASEFLAFCLFSASLLQYFSEVHNARHFEEAAPVDGPSRIDRLAEARQAFSISPRAAWDTALGFREENQLEPNPLFPSLSKT
jgi:hypothetical protein